MLNDFLKVSPTFFLIFLKNERRFETAAPASIQGTTTSVPLGRRRRRQRFVAVSVQSSTVSR
jgi:hypothetical protein